MKVHIRTTCSFCEGEAYLPVRKTVSCTEIYFPMRIPIKFFEGEIKYLKEIIPTALH